MFDFLKKLLGTKSEKDIKNLESRVQEINSIFNSLQALSHDDLRARTQNLKAKMMAAAADQLSKISETRSRVESDPNIDVNAKEELYKEIEGLEKELGDIYETQLTDNLPEAFAILKETARRFKENKEIEITCKQFSCRTKR